MMLDYLLTQDGGYACTADPICRVIWYWLAGVAVLLSKERLRRTPEDGNEGRYQRETAKYQWEVVPYSIPFGSVG